jgi:homocysteine S-methyltransferase
MKTSKMQKVIDAHDLIFTEAAIIEALRRSADVNLHPRLENTLLIYEEAGRIALTTLYQNFIQIARHADVPILICAPTWRANRERLSAAKIARDANADAVSFLMRVKEEYGARAANIVIGGLVGCKNDCYKPAEGLSTPDAQAFHRWQVTRLAAAGADFLLAATLPALPEAAGIAQAMAHSQVPYIISFVIDKRGRLLDGNSLEKAIGKIDAVCSPPPLGFMINCAYPSFLNAQVQPTTVISRLIGYQANASSLDHAQLDGADTLQSDNIVDWGNRMIALNKNFGVKILGGCCGTTHEHLQYIARNINRLSIQPPPVNPETYPNR